MTAHPPIRLGVRIPPCGPVTEVAAAVRRAEEAGFDAVAMPDSPTLWRDTFAALCVAATATEQIALWTAVTSISTRNPISLASSARTVAELAPGRFRLGLGAADSAGFLTGQGRATTGQLRRGIRAIKSLVTGAPTRFGETTVTLQDGCGPIPVYLAAEGPKNTALAVEVADGLMTYLREVERQAAKVSELRAAGDRTDDFELIASGPVAITDDVARDTQYIKPLVVKAVQAHPGAQAWFAEAGFDIHPPAEEILLPDGTDQSHPRDVAEAVRVASQWVTDEAAVWYARQIGIFGTAEEVAERLRHLEQLGVREFHVSHGGSFDYPDALIEAVSTEVIPRLRAS
ncbi:LLM class flavin-dependent oxidoreductase [Granulicoccus phenolivorans]|uniref:LLM class flavin-dependent oxidoreductase n=1 Tax=Granulicoccus phenolivorans TaxID=266854 RepID=UPI000428529B|nr:LLM class flavin-dependent oxidoreductase [Granulicoccus phenolivorans]